MRRWLAIVALAVLVGSCTERPVGAVVADTPRGRWHSGESIEVGYDNRDTLSLYDLAVVVRGQASSAQEAMPLRVRCTSPSGVSFESGVVILPEERHGGGSFAESEGAWIRDARLAEMGEYRFAFTPECDLAGVWSVGMKIQN
ncbi:MAG: hypothetical protein IKY63_06640 [Tidjanibacter sp.]|nr:hypothetical protein [Tidjanibacter sp.]